MKNFDFETYHVWQPDFRQALSYAIRQKNKVHVSTNFPIDDCNRADIIFSGRFVGFSGPLLQFVVEEFVPDISNALPQSPECEYIFTADIPLPGSGRSLLEYGGRAYIIDQDLQSNDLPESLLLRLSHPNRLRRLRRHTRITNPEKMFLMPGMLIMDQEPLNRRRLLALLGHYYKQKMRPKPQLIDISAGGACLKTLDSHYQRFMGAEESYLFFFFSENNGVLDVPNVFMAKKVGLYRGEDACHTGLRIKFLRELIWTPPNEELKWINIESSGSEKIKRMFEEWQNEFQENEKD